MRKSRTIVFGLLGILIPFGVFGQTPLSGIINTYIPVTGVRASTCSDCLPGCSDTLTVASPVGLSTVAGAPGNKVLIIQMEAGTAGAINNGPAFQFSAAYGAVTNYGGAGNYEFATIDTIIGNDITFERPLLFTYDPAGVVQIIPVTVYANATTTGPLLGQPYNGTTGGVLVLETSGTLTLNHNIDLDTCGFQGGIFQNNQECCHDNIAAALQFAYFWDETAGGGGPPCSANRQWKFGNDKGTGIFPLITGQRIGRGAFANAGGGGSGHNTGGGGGGNMMAGGNGGFEWDGCGSAGVDSMNGIGGYAIAGPASLFLGGGGGAGHGNNSAGTSGGNGGGIIIVIANQINVNAPGLEITADGQKPTAIANNDAAGGGGAGGSILLEVNSFSGQPLTVSATGGDGGDNNVGSSCHGPGGGGGGGMVGTLLPQPIAGVTIDASGGAPGTHLVLTASCGIYGAGSGGSSAPIGNLSPNENNCGPLENWIPLLSGTAQPEGNLLQWNAPGDNRFSTFRVEQSPDARTWLELDLLTADEDKSEYAFWDYYPAETQLFYRVIGMNSSGNRFPYQAVSLYRENPAPSLLIYPQPAGDNSPIHLDCRNCVSGKGLQVIDLNGKIVQNIPLNEDNQAILPYGTLASGLYLVRYEGPGVAPKKLSVR